MKLLSRFTTRALRLPVRANKAIKTRLLSAASAPAKENVIILGAAGRDFHDFITYWSTAPNVEVKCFTETQIPGIDNRMFPKEM